MTFFTGLATATVGLGMIAYRVPLDARILAILLVMGLLCALGNVCIFIALRNTTAATVSQYHYTQLISGAVAAYLMFHEEPTRSTLAGAALIVASGLYIAMRAGQAEMAR
jgi:drug/metabolite transporter (DMT)-like permease